MGSVTELGLPSRLRLPKLSGRLSTIRIEDVQRVGLALVLTVCLWTLVAHNFWDASVLFASAISSSPGELTLGPPFVRRTSLRRSSCDCSGSSSLLTDSNEASLMGTTTHLE